MHGFEVVQAQVLAQRGCANDCGFARRGRARSGPGSHGSCRHLFCAGRGGFGHPGANPRETRQFGAYLIGTTGLFYTSNPSLSNDAGRGDLYFVGGGGAGLRPNVVGGLYLDGHVSDQVFQYAQFSSLNFNYFNAGGGLDYVFEGLGQLTASVRYELQRYIDSGSLDEFYVNNALTDGTLQAVSNQSGMWIQTGWLGSWSLTCLSVCRSAARKRFLARLALANL